MTCIRKNNFMISCVMLVCAAIFTVGCGNDEGKNDGETEKIESTMKDESATTMETVKKEAGETVEVSKEFIADKLAEYQSEMDEAKAWIDRKLAELDKKAEKAKEEARMELQETKKQLENQWKSVEDTFAKLQKATGTAWKELDSGFSDAMDTFKKNMDSEAEEKEMTPEQSGS